MPLAMKSQIRAGGRSLSSGQERSATQIGNVFVNVSTWETGRRVNAKNVHTRLMLPAMLRIHSERGPQKTNRAPAASVNAVAKTIAKKVRLTAMTRQSQSQSEPRACAIVAINAKARLPHTIQT